MPRPAAVLAVLLTLLTASPFTAPAFSCRLIDILHASAPRNAPAPGTSLHGVTQPAPAAPVLSDDVRALKDDGWEWARTATGLRVAVRQIQRDLHPGRAAAARRAEPPLVLRI